MIRFLSILLALAAPLAAAQKPRYTALEVFDKVLAAQDEKAWTSADIEKTEKAAGEKKGVVSKGAFKSKPGGLSRLDLSAPEPGLILSDGKHLFVELPQVEQVMQYSASKLKESGNFFLDLAPTIRHYAKVSLCRLIPPGAGFDPEKVSALELQPKKAGQAGFEKMRVWVRESDWSILQVRLDYGGTQSTVLFKNHQSVTKRQLEKDPTKDLNPLLFRYKAPAGYQVFDLDM
jgi:outer membrane lipoprotein-sorting protein